jgi:hypothetical protein
LEYNEREVLRKEFLEIHRQLGNASLPYVIRCKMEKRKDETIKEYFKKFGKHISAEV